MIPGNHTKRRLDQILSRLGYGSRKDATTWARNGWITVDGAVIKNASVKVDPHAVCINDEPLDHPDDLFIILNKPAGIVCSHDMSEGTRIYDLLPPRWVERRPQPVSIGRLDKDTTGIILITDILPLVHYFTSPKHTIEKVYEVTLDREPDAQLAATFAAGTIVLEDDPKACRPAKLEILAEKKCRVTLTEGRYHQVRRMFAALGYHVETLHRSRFGQYELGELPGGEWIEAVPPELATSR
jgi:16S rRNA pseudouridine516 synthase